MHYQDLTSFSFLFPIPTKVCLKAWKANKNTAKSSGAVTFLSFCVLSGDNYLASHQAAPTRMLSFSMWIWCKSEFAACLYTLHLSTLNRPQIMMATKTRRMCQQFDWRARHPRKATCPVMMPSAAGESSEGYLPWGLGKYCCLGAPIRGKEKYQARLGVYLWSAGQSCNQWNSHWWKRSGFPSERKFLSFPLLSEPVFTCHCCLLWRWLDFWVLSTILTWWLVETNCMCYI